MEQIQLHQIEDVKYKRVCEIADFVAYPYCTRKIDDDTLRSLGVVKLAALDVDEMSPLDFEPRFFTPSHDEKMCQDIKEREKHRPTWLSSMDCDKDKYEDWVQSAPEVYPSFKSEWFMIWWDKLQETMWHSVYDNREKRKAYEGRTHNVWRHAADVDSSARYRIPGKVRCDVDYDTYAVMEPTNSNKPHLGIVIGDPEVPGENEGMLASEVDAAASMIKWQFDSGLFPDHHTKPVIVFTFMWESHGRITQAHFDGSIDKLVVRQSRLFDFMGEDVEVVPQDAYIFFRWMMNTPIGETKYQSTVDEQLEDKHDEAPNHPNLITAQAG